MRSSAKIKTAATLILTLTTTQLLMGFDINPLNTENNGRPFINKTTADLNSLTFEARRAA